MKNNHIKTSLSLKLLSHHIIRIKSNAFLKLVLYAEAADDYSVTTENEQSQTIQSMCESIRKIAVSKEKEMIRIAFERIKLAGWKMILQAHAEEEEDSKPSSMIIQEKLCQSSPTILPSSTIIQRETINVPYFGNSIISGISSMQQSKVNLKQRSSYEMTIDTSRNSQRQLRLRKRALILKKLQNVEMCVDYMQFCAGLEYNVPPHKSFSRIR